jgi:membrane associated rhomboid family serine protease
MEIQTRLVANIFTRKLSAGAWPLTLAWVLLVYGASYLFLEKGISLEASGLAVFQRHEWWRAWSALLVHSDLAHLLSNTPWLVVFMFLLNGVFGAVPVLLAFLITGLGNFIVLASMPPQVSLVGASGVVHFVGAMWVTLHVLADHREGLRPRFGSGLFLLLMLFIPGDYRPNISYLGHALGFILGITTGLGYYLLNRQRFSTLEVYETRLIPPVDFDWSGEDVPVNSPQSAQVEPTLH